MDYTESRNDSGKLILSQNDTGIWLRSQKDTGIWILSQIINKKDTGIWIRSQNDTRIWIRSQNDIQEYGIEIRMIQGCGLVRSQNDTGIIKDWK